ncbi:MAG TPA: lamin tail domain-containing protein, partial [Flavisolibacter sp.]
MFTPKIILMFCSLLLLSSLGAQQAGRYDVVICEIMADPSPAVGLPGVEYIEIRNVSATPLPLLGWRLSDASGTATINTGFILQPDSSLILCSVANASLLAPYGRTVGVGGFPSLDNDGEELVLRSPQN